MTLRFTQILGVLVFCLLASFTVSAQTTITGTITSAEDNEPLIGATVLVKGTNTGTVTDLDGNFEISANQGDVLVISYTGMQPQEVTVGAQTDLTLQLTPSSMVLEEVVVTGYGEQDRSSFSGSSVNVAVEKIENAPRVSFQESLQGNVAGLFLTQNNGQPGANQQVRIRGIGSFSASAEPLYVIDGIPVVSGNTTRDAFGQGNTIAGLNPNDIESITVLKDASATSLYGSRGANGVIVITTKSGNKGKPQVDINFSYGINQPTLTDRNRPLNTAEYLELQYEGVINAGLADNLNDAKQYIWDRLPSAAFTSGSAPVPGQDSPADFTSTDWFDEVTREGSFLQTSASVQGGDDRLTYYASGSFTDNQGTIIGTGYKRYTAALGITANMGEWLDVGANVNYNQQNLETQAGGGFFANPVRAMYRLVPWAPVRNDDGSFFTGINSTYNPVGLAEENYNLSFITNFLGSINAKVKFPLKGLTYEPRFSFNQISTDEENWSNPDFGGGRNVGGSAQWLTNDFTDMIVTNLLKYNTYINDAHGLNFTLGHEAQKRSQKFSDFSNQNFPVPGLETPSNGSDPQSANGGKTENTLQGYFAIASYNFKGLFYLDGTIRRDGSSRFGANNRWGTFWSVGTRLNLERFGFLTGNPLITKLSLRASYGENGNQGIGNFESRGLYSSGADYAGNPGIILSQLENADLTWEKNRPFNVGVEVGLWNRVFVNLDYYNRVTSSLLLDVPISRTNGVTSVIRNEGELRNQGIELTVTTFNIQNPSGFNWNTDFNMTLNRNTILELGPEGDFVAGKFKRIVGEDINTIWAPGYVGADPDTGDPLWYVDSTETATTSVYSEAERYAHGTTNPDLFGGITNTLSYKGITLSFQFNFVLGGQVYDNWTGFTHTDGRRGLNTTGNVARKIYNNRWRQPGDQTNVPKFVYLNRSNSQAYSTRYFYNGTFVRLRDITLSYSLPRSLTSRWKMRNIQLYVRANNLWTWIKDDGLERDPQADVNGDLDQEIPVPRTFVGGLNISF